MSSRKYRNFDWIYIFIRVKDKFTIIHPSDVVLLEGILVFYHKDVMNMFDMKLFVDTDADTRLARRGKHLLNHSYILATILGLLQPQFPNPTDKYTL
jgi:uridine kinase